MARTKEEIYIEYIGNGQMGIDFEKKHILEAMESYHKEKLREELVEFGIWLDNNTKHYIFEEDINDYLNSR